MDDFEDACRKGYLAIRKHSQELFQMLEMSSFSAGAGTVLPCLEGDAVEEVKKRLKLNSSDHDAQLVSVSPHLCLPQSLCLYSSFALLVSCHLCPTSCKLRRVCARISLRLVAGLALGLIRQAFTFVLEMLHGLSDGTLDLRMLSDGNGFCTQHMSAELQKAKEHFSTGLLDQIHNWTHANV